MTLNEELIQLRQQVKELEKENRRLKKENDFLEEASAFFAAQQKRKNEVYCSKNGRRRIKREYRLFLQGSSCQ